MSFFRKLHWLRDKRRITNPSKPLKLHWLSEGLQILRSYFVLNPLLFFHFKLMKKVIWIKSYSNQLF
ncbi:MAG TPA: hypothetical protein DEF82_01775 [Crocinitomicaceae bacterium]|nr:hypothetical protein [Flavobacteriales bacterium]HBW85500.1 hypothetical protein [Crocinitomicaceae bacterium]